jgi:hypothetical protein
MPVLKLSDIERKERRRLQHRISYRKHRRKIIGRVSDANRDRIKAAREALAGRTRPDKCEICRLESTKKGNPLCFDHDHLTGQFRGWICDRCNRMLGWVKDNPEYLRLLATYLEQPKEDAPIVPSGWTAQTTTLVNRRRMVGARLLPF